MLEAEEMDLGELQSSKGSTEDPVPKPTNQTNKHQNHNNKQRILVNSNSWFVFSCPEIIFCCETKNPASSEWRQSGREVLGLLRLQSGFSFCCPHTDTSNPNVYQMVNEYIKCHIATQLTHIWPLKK